MRLEVSEIAKNNLETYHNLTGPEKLAVLEFEKLSLLSGYDFLTNILRSESITKIHKQGLHLQHPEKFNTPEEGIEVTSGLSSSEQHNITDIVNIIIPWLEENMDMDGFVFWDSVKSKSKIREIVPYLKRVISGEKSERGTVNDAIERFEDDARSIDPDIDDEELKKQVINHIITLAASNKTTDLRETLRPNGTPKIHGLLMKKKWLAKVNGKPVEREATILLAELSADQIDKLIRQGAFEFDRVDLELYTVMNTEQGRRLISQSNEV